MVCVIVLNWNGWRDTLVCLDSLAEVLDPPIRILVVDNGSTNESVTKIREYIAGRGAHRELMLIENGTNAGFAGGMNAGMREALKADPQWLLVLNNDTTVDPAFLRIMLDAASTDERIGMLNPKILLLEHPDTIWSAGGRVNWMRTKGSHVGYAERDTGQYDQPPIQETDYATGGCVLLRREMLEAIGLMPEIYFLYYEDVEWSARAQNAGWRTVVVPAAKIWHKGAASTKEFSDAYIRYHVRNGLLHARRTGNALTVAVAYTVSLLRFAWQLVKWLGMPKKRRWARATMLGILDAWRGKGGYIQPTNA